MQTLSPLISTMWAFPDWLCTIYQGVVLILCSSNPWILFGRTEAEAEALILWPPDVKGQLIEKDPDAGKDWRQKEKKVTEDKMVG